MNNKPEAMPWTDTDHVNHIMESKLLSAKTWTDLAEKHGVNPILLAAGCLGHRIMRDEEAAGISASLKLCPLTKRWLSQPKILRITAASGTSDPIITRFQEAVNLYGPALALLIRERLGDGIMSAVDFSVQLREKGNRVEIVWSGKFLPYTEF